MGTETTGFVHVKGLGERVQEAEATEAALIRDLKRLNREDQQYIHQVVWRLLLDHKKRKKI